MPFGEPWTSLLTAGVPSVLVAYVTYRGLKLKESLGAGASEAARVDSMVREMIDRTMADNARLRKEASESSTAMSSLMSIARRWCDLCHEMRHGRNNDRHIANAMLERAGAESVDWKPIPRLPGFEEI